MVTWGIDSVDFISEVKITQPRTLIYGAIALLFLELPTESRLCALAYHHVFDVPLELSEADVLVVQLPALGVEGPHLHGVVPARDEDVFVDEAEVAGRERAAVGLPPHCKSIGGF